MTHNIDLLKEAIQKYPTLLARGLTGEALARYGCVASQAGQIEVPLFSPLGEQVGRLLRMVSGNPKYIIEPAAAKLYLYNCKSSVVFSPALPILLVESPFDVMALPGLQVYGLIGVELSAMGLWCLQQIRSSGVIIALDDDASGRAASLRLASKLTSKGITSIVHIGGLASLRDDYEELAVELLAMHKGSLIIRGVEGVPLFGLYSS